MRLLNNKLLTVLGLLLCTFAKAGSVVVGTMYPIAEKDALQEIEERAAKADWKQMYNKPPDEWSAFTSVKLPQAREENERKHKIVYVTEQDVIDKDGRILYPKGYEYNSLDYIRMPYRIIVIGDQPEHIEWVKQIANAEDEVWTAGGNPRQLSSKLNGKPVFILTDDAARKLNLRAVPTVISQLGNELVLREYYVATD